MKQLHMSPCVDGHRLKKKMFKTNVCIIERERERERERESKPGED